MERLYAVRGAVTVDEDTREQVVERTQSLLWELVSRNQIATDDIVSIVFTATNDIHSEFPAAAARLMGFEGVPLLCAAELDISSSLTMPRCIRILMHFYGERRPQPVYLGETVRLQVAPDPV